MLCRDDINGSMFTKNARRRKTEKKFFIFHDEESLENLMEILMKYLKGEENSKVFPGLKTKINFTELKYRFSILITFLNLK